jgi:multiple sugar transport system ATP-binding protein
VVAVVAVEVRHVSKRYGRNLALDDVSLSIGSGEFVAVVGPTSCGKSTLLRLVGGLESPTSGDLFIDGELANRIPTRDRQVGMVSQEYALYPHLTVFDNIAFPLRQSKEFRGQEVDQRVRDVSHRLNLDDVLDCRPSELAGGQRQRVALGRAIARNARVLLFDEPLSNVDASLRPAMIRELTDLHDRLAITTLYVTHDQMDALRLADRVAVLDQGRLQQVGTPRDLLDEPANLFVAGFVGAPPMSFVPARLIGDLVHLPFGLFRLTASRLARVPSGGTFVAGVRPEYAHDTMVLDPTDDDLVEITEDSMGVPLDMLDFERDLAGVSVRGAAAARVTPLLASLRAEGLMPPGRDSRVFVDTRKIHLFDPATGVNLTRDGGSSTPSTAPL